MKRNRFSIQQRLKSFQYAFNGLKTLLVEEHNARIHLFASIVVIGLAGYFQINRLEWIVILFFIALVWTAEAFNSAIENLADFVCIENHPQIKKVKDLSAAAVLIIAFAALVVGLIVFFPYLKSLFNF